MIITIFGEFDKNMKLVYDIFYLHYGVLSINW